MPEASEFDIYQTDAGYVAVTNEARRQILEALAKADRDLNHLMRVTGKAKPTLSNIHMRELLAQGLVEERPHPTDARRKVYVLRGRRIGSSNIPLEQLRGAVKQYATTSPLVPGLPLGAILEALAAGGAAQAETLRRQGARLGRLAARAIPGTSPRELVAALAPYLEREGVGRAARIDFDALALDLDADPRYGDGRDGLGALGAALAGFLDGLLAERGLGGAPHVDAAANGRLRLAFGPAPLVS